MGPVIKINHLISTQVSFFKCNVEKTKNFRTGYPFQLHFGLMFHIICILSRRNIHVYMLYTGYGPPRLITRISLDQSLTVLVVKHNIQLSTK